MSTILLVQQLFTGHALRYRYLDIAVPSPLHDYCFTVLIKEAARKWTESYRRRRRVAGPRDIAEQMKMLLK